MYDIEKVIHLFKSHDKVKFILTGQGERECDTKNFELSMKELEHRIAKSPLEDSVMDENFHSGIAFERNIKVCPKCNNIYLYEKQLFCDKCGQKLENQL